MMIRWGIQWSSQTERVSGTIRLRSKKMKLLSNCSNMIHSKDRATDRVSTPVLQRREWKRSIWEEEALPRKWWFKSLVPEWEPHLRFIRLPRRIEVPISSNLRCLNSDRMWGCLKENLLSESTESVWGFKISSSLWILVGLLNLILKNPIVDNKIGYRTTQSEEEITSKLLQLLRKSIGN